MVRLDDFDIRVIAEYPRRHFQQFQRQVYTHAEIRGEHDGNILARLGQQLLLCGIQPGGADDHGLARLAAERQVFQHDFRQREVDQHIELFRHRIQIARQRHADTPQRSEFAGIHTNQRAARPHDGGRQTGQWRTLLHRLDQDFTHAPGGTHHSNTSHACLLTNRRRSASRLRTSQWFSANGCCRPPANCGTLRAFRVDDGSD
ncbi:hypothetical protein D3C71_1329340 [compost metagenome]